jgi:hypothetical protein
VAVPASVELCFDQEKTPKDATILQDRRSFDPAFDLIVDDSAINATLLHFGNYKLAQRWRWWRPLIEGREGPL